MRVALVHDWLTGMRGGEYVLEAMIDEFPDAEIFTLLHVPGSVSTKIESRPIHTSFVTHAPFARQHYRKYLPVFPLAIETLRPRGFDVVISSSHCVAKAVRTGGTKHLCYCHTPVRYAWDQFDEYFVDRAFARALATPAAAALRTWDRATANRVDHFIANSNTVRDRIQKNYSRESTVIFPPVNVARFARPRAPSDFYLLVGALVPYKRIDRAIAACAQANRRLVIVGDGPDRKRLEAHAPPHVDFRGHVSDEVLAQLYSECRALIMPGVEDFGISAVEAQAAGAPVIALASGGALDTVSQDTGVLVADATVDAFADAFCKLESTQFDERVARENAARFGTDNFRSGLRSTVQTLLA